MIEEVRHSIGDSGHCSIKLVEEIIRKMSRIGENEWKEH
jgi:hypothetical protein